jgi:hypothetical protein
MMHFINPVEILNLAATDLTTIDDTVIKRAKKAVLAEIDLSDDGFFGYHGQQLTRADCERVIDDLEQRDKLEFYHFIANHTALSNFLVKADETFFTAFRYESIYKLPEFVRFISPYFAAAYDGMLWKAWQRKDASFGLLIAIDPIVTPDDIEVSYKSLRDALNRYVDDIQILKEKVEDTTQEVDVTIVRAQINVLIDKELLNTLPPYFQELRNLIAVALRNLSVAINNTRANLRVAKQMHQELMLLKTDGVARETIIKDYDVLVKIEQENSLQDGNDAVVSEYLKLIRNIGLYIQAATNERSDLSGIKTWVGNNIDIAEISALDGKYKAIKNRIAVQLRDLGVNIWNHHLHKEAAISYLDMAVQIEGLEQETLDLLVQTKMEIRAGIDSPAQINKVPDGSLDKFQKRLLFIAFAVILVFVMIKGCSH